jgi:hypothetical protein
MGNWQDFIFIKNFLHSLLTRLLSFTFAKVVVINEDFQSLFY